VIDTEEPGDTGTPPINPAPRVPFFVLNQLSVTSAGDGIAECRTNVLPWLGGTPELGIHAAAAGLMDIVLSYAASTAATETEMFVSLGMRIQHWEAPPPVGTTLTGCASVLTDHAGMTLSSGRIQAGGVTFASGTLQSMSVPRIPGASPSGHDRSREDRAAVSEDTRAPGVGQASSESHSRPREDESVAAILELPVSAMCGLRVERASPNQIDIAVVAPPSFERTGGVIHGGALPILGQLACAALIARTLDRGCEARRTEFAVDYLRPAFVGRPYALTAGVVHRSRRVMIVAGEVLDETGRLVSRYSETSILS
jgi:uncharacterized protein (TIGR00369 family)